MAYARNKHKGTFENIDELNNSPKRKGFFQLLAGAFKSLPGNDEDLVVEPVNENEVATFKATLAALTHTTEPEVVAKEYRACLKTRPSRDVRKKDVSNINIARNDGKSRDDK